MIRHSENALRGRSCVASSSRVSRRSAHWHGPRPRKARVCIRACVRDASVMGSSVYGSLSHGSRDASGIACTPLGTQTRSATR